MIDKKLLGKNSRHGEEIDAFIRSFNLKRVLYIAVSFMLLQFCLILDPARRAQPLIFAGFVFSFVICLIYIAFVGKHYGRIVKDGRISLLTFNSFWLLLYVSFIPNMAADLVLGALPVTPIVFYAIMVITRVFSSLEGVYVFSAATAANVALGLYYRAGAPYLAMTVGFGIICVGLSYLVQQQYVMMILKLRIENTIDSLTGILNRKGGIDRAKMQLELCKRHSEMMAFYMIDIDYFKSFNDTYGHQRGDEILKVVGETLEDVFERRSDIVCRYGGEEFLVCAGVGSVRDADILARRVLHSIEGKKIETPLKLVSRYLTVSVGYVVYKPNGRNISATCDMLISHADNALYKAKDQGRNRVVYQAWEPEVVVSNG